MHAGGAGVEIAAAVLVLLGGGLHQCQALAPGAREVLRNLD